MMKGLLFTVVMLVGLLAVGCSSSNNTIGPDLPDETPMIDGETVTEKPPDIFDPPGGDPDDLLGGDNRPW